MDSGKTRRRRRPAASVVICRFPSPPPLSSFARLLRLRSGRCSVVGFPSGFRCPLRLLHFQVALNRLIAALDAPETDRGGIAAHREIEGLMGNSCRGSLGYKPLEVYTELEEQLNSKSNSSSRSNFQTSKDVADYVVDGKLSRDGEGVGGDADVQAVKKLVSVDIVASVC